MRAGDADLAAVLAPLADADEDERLVAIAYVGGRDLAIDEGELSAAIRRSQLLLATGGDPRRALELHGRAVVALADDLDAEDRRAALQAGLALLSQPLAALPELTETLTRLRGDDDLAWRAYAGALLADSLSDDVA